MSQPGPIPLTLSAQLSIAVTLTLVGAGADATIIQAATTPGVAGHRVFIIFANINVAISGVTIRHGHGTGGAGIFNSGETLTLNDCTITENRTGPGAAGGAIFNSGGGTLTVINSTISNNTAASAGGIGIFDGTVTVINSTISNNTASDLGGGFINQQPGASLTLINSTVSGNTASETFGGGGIAIVDGTAELVNTIIANNPSGGDCGFFSTSVSLTSLGHNLDGDNTCNLNSAGDLSGVNPLLGSLQDNGGPTETHALLPGSPAIDGGNPAPPGSGGNACEATDQRGISRPQGTACDIGAFELVELFVAHFGSGGGLQSDVVVFNPSSTASASGEVNFFDPDGAPLDSSGFLPGGNSFTLSPLGSATLSTTGAGSTVITGSATVTSDIPISAVIRFDITGVGVAGVEASQVLTSAIAPVRRIGTLSSGVAVRNTGTSTIQVTLELKDESGNVVSGGTETKALAGNGRIAEFIETLFPNAVTTNFTGTICVTAREQPTGPFIGKIAENQISVIVLELDTANNVFTTLPVSAVN